MFKIKNKKGTIDDVIYLMAVLFAIFVIVIIVHRTWRGINESGVLRQQGEAAAEVDAIVTYNIMPALDYWPLSFVFFGTLVICILAFITRSSPLFIPIALVIIVLTIIVAHAVSEAGVGIMNARGLEVEKEQMDISFFIMDNLEIIMLLISCLVMIVTYGFFSEGGGI